MECVCREFVEGVAFWLASGCRWSYPQVCCRGVEAIVDVSVLAGLVRPREYVNCPYCLLVRLFDRMVTKSFNSPGFSHFLTDA